mmetsp:Transcript_8451/g.13711  ORF Transcript_8451/g.13711 Transcript_8451/m.13711 type:complete len:315 (-) Transcript_8451:1051-1995(-)
MGSVDCCVLELCRNDGVMVSGSGPRCRKSKCMVVNDKMLTQVIKRVRKRLYICYSGGKVETAFIRENLARLYNDLWDAALDADNLGVECSVLMACDQLGDLETLLRSEEGKCVDVIFNAGPRIDSLALVGREGYKVESLEDCLQEEAFGVPYILYDNIEDSLPEFSKVAVGGTFDHFHNGHRKLLSICASVCKVELIVGVTADSMLAQKKLKDLIEDIQVRKKHVENFMGPIAGANLKLNVVTIEDVWGPTAVIADIEALVCSTETLKGARMINEERERRGFKSLAIVAVARSNAFTLSSTFVRRWTQQKQSSI